MFEVAELGGMQSPKKVKEGITVCKAQFLVHGKNFVKPIVLAVFNENIEKVQSLKKGQKVILEYTERLNKGYLNLTYLKHIADEKKIKQFEEIVQ